MKQYDGGMRGKVFFRATDASDIIYCAAKNTRKLEKISEEFKQVQIVHFRHLEMEVEIP